MSNPCEFQVTLLDDDKHLPEADINHPVLIESVAVSKGRGLHVPTPEGHTSVRSTGEGIRTVVHIKDSGLERPDNKKPDLEDLDVFLEQELQKMEPLLSSVAVAQAICSCHRIGSSWVVSYGGEPIYLITLHAAVNVNTGEIESIPCRSWDSMLGVARKQLDRIYHDHVLYSYQESLKYLDRKGNKMLNEAKSMDGNKAVTEF